MKNLKLALFILSFMSSTEAFSNFTFGSFGAPIGRVRVDREETRSALSLNPYLGVYYKYRSFSPWVIDFEFDYAFPKSSYDNIQEPKTKSRMLLWHINGNYYFQDNFIYGITGLTTVVTKVTGDGGAVVINDRTFFVPEKPKESSYNMLINLGVGLEFNPSFYGEFKTHIWRILSSDARAFSISFALKYNFFSGNSI